MSKTVDQVQCRGPVLTFVAAVGVGTVVGVVGMVGVVAGIVPQEEGHKVPTVCAALAALAALAAALAAAAAMVDKYLRRVLKSNRPTIKAGATPKETWCIARIATKCWVCRPPRT